MPFASWTMMVSSKGDLSRSRVSLGILTLQPEPRTVPAARNPNRPGSLKAPVYPLSLPTVTSNLDPCSLTAIALRRHVRLLLLHWAPSSSPAGAQALWHMLLMSEAASSR